ncbi:MAG: hypothetical protein ACLFQ8_02760 [Candidatus Aenigmatarchaeota archaeon]
MGESNGIDEETAEEISEYIVPYVASEGIFKDTITLQKLRRDFKDTSSRRLRQGIIHGLENEELYRTRIWENGRRKAALSVKSPPEKIANEINNMGEKWEEERFSRKYTYSLREEIEAPETKYDYSTFSEFPELFARHMERHEDIDSWNKNMTLGEEKVSASWVVTDSDSKTMKGEREVNYELSLENDHLELSAELTLKKRKDGLWSVDPLEAETYLKAALGMYQGTRFKVIEERGEKAEEFAELAADLIFEDENYSFEDWNSNFKQYRDFLIDGKEPEKYFDKEKDERGVPLSSDLFLKKLDGFVDDMKGSETKHDIKKDTPTADKNIAGPIDEFLDYVEDAIYGRLKSGSKEG